MNCCTLRKRSSIPILTQFSAGLPLRDVLRTVPTLSPSLHRTQVLILHEERICSALLSTSGMINLAEMKQQGWILPACFILQTNLYYWYQATSRRSLNYIHPQILQSVSFHWSTYLLQKILQCNFSTTYTVARYDFYSFAFSCPISDSVQKLVPEWSVPPEKHCTDSSSLDMLQQTLTGRICHLHNVHNKQYRYLAGPAPLKIWCNFDITHLAAPRFWIYCRHEVARTERF
jgi:hypothetical protein